MSRICLVATGVPSGVDSDTHHGPGLRAGHFASALTAAGHEVLVVAILPEGDRNLGRLPPTFTVGGHCVDLVESTEKRVGSAELAQRVSRFAPDGFVGVSTMASAMACGLAADLPLWADLFGDLMAEAQAKAAVHDSDVSLPRFWGLLAQALERGDRFSAVSQAQASAVVGQLGLTGRLSAATMGEELVQVIPCAAVRVARPDEARVRDFRGRLGLVDSFVVLSNGSFNTWCDVDTLYDALETAMHRSASMRFLATGGAVAGHDERSYRRFRERISAGPYAERFHLLGWRPGTEIPIYYELADLALNLERDCYERRLGSENRVVEWLAAGVPVVSTALSEQGRELAALDVIEAVECGDAEDIAERLLSLSGNRPRLEELSANALSYVESALGLNETAAPLVEWANHPIRAADAGDEPLLRVGLVSEPKTMVALLESYADELGTVELLRRGLRWIWRRLSRG